MHAELLGVIVPEMELTMRVAVMSAASFTRPQMVAELGCTELEVKAALHRLQKIASRW